MSDFYPRIGKRLLDVLLALAITVPAALVCLVCVCVIRLESDGPAVFRQVRVGRGRRHFILYKLRTMAKDTGNLPSHEVSKVSITRFGAVLRKTKLDELPQLLNVLRGDMSFVGPRPCLPSQQLLVAEREKRGVYAVRPGITGPAQIAGIDMSTPVELAEADSHYLAAISLAADMGFLLKTAVGSGRGDAVTRA
ncbi:sugar transferase [Ancylobacter sp.]|uniref:sugar transferase n=1 Tax=Ancylobacter sp. TaxID=1872567 RepID=UPI003D0D89E5